MSATIKLSSPATREFWEIPVLYEDEHLLVLDKPAGLAVSPNLAAPDRPSLMKLLHGAIAEAKPWAAQRGLRYLMNAHRLDPEASGVLVLAKNKLTLTRLADRFGAEKPCRSCLALVAGVPAADAFESEAKLAPHPIRPEQMRVDPRGGKRSRTRFSVVERFAGWTLLKCVPFTDRPHQVRAHLRHLRLPLAGDALYGGTPLRLSALKRDYRPSARGPERPLINRAALHAELVTIPHPATGEPLTITAPWPKDLAVAVKYLRRFSPPTT